MKEIKSKKVDLGKEPVNRLLLMLAIPAITSQLVNALYNMVDRIYIGHIPEVGSAALTGVGVCFPIIMTVTAFAYLFGVGGAPRASIFMGKGDKETAEKILGNCFSALVITAIILTSLVLIFKEQMLYIFGASENTIQYAESYITVYALGTVFVQLTLGLNAFISAQGFSKVSMMTVVIGAILNIVLDPVFIFVFKIGVSGAALATVISQAISTIWALRFVLGKNTVLHLKKENMKIDPGILLPCIGLGVAPFAMTFTESALVLCFNSSLLKYGGDMAVGAMTILSSIRQLVMMPVQGFTQGGQPIISFNYGAKNSERVKQAFKMQSICCVAYASAMWALIELFPSFFVGVFTDNAELAGLASWALRIYLATIMVMGVQNTCQQTFVAFGKSKVSAFLAVLRKVILLIPMIFILPIFLEDDVFAVFVAEPIADVIAVSVTVTLFTLESKRMFGRDAADNFGKL